VAREELFDDPDTIMRFLEAHETACSFIRESRRAAQIVAKLTDIVDPGFVLEAYRIPPNIAAPSPRNTWPPPCALSMF